MGSTRVSRTGNWNMKPQISSPKNQKIALMFCGTVCAVVYAILAVDSETGTGIGLFNFLGGFWFIAAMVLVYWYYLVDNTLEISFGAVVAWAVVFRVIGIFGSPILEDDFYRYLLDGCVFVASGSPYGVSPSSLFAGNELSAECRAALNWVNNPDLPTIYGPLLQLIFALAHILSPANIDLLQGVLVIFDIGLIMLLRGFTSPRTLILYAWNPLVIKEIAFTAHPDIVGVFFMVAAFVACYNRQMLVASILIGLACTSKIFAVLALPFILFRQPLRYWLATAAVIALVYAPFAFQGHTDMLVVGIFAERWVFNATGFAVASWLLPDMAARFACLGLFIAWYLFYFYRHQQAGLSPGIPRIDWVFGVFFLLSPVVNPWYLLWLLPFAVIRPSYFAWTASVVVTLTYVTGLHLVESDLHAYQIEPMAMALQVAALLTAVVADWRSGHFVIKN